MEAGGGSDDDDILGIVVTPDGRVLSGTEPVAPSDFVGRTFPLLFASAQDQSPQAVTQAGTGSIKVVDDNTIVVTLPGGAANAYARISATEFSDGLGEVLTFEDSGSARYFFKSAGDPSTELLGSFGFETPVALRPVSARYGATSASVLLLAPEGSAQWAGLGAGGSVDLIATFTGSGGTIRGTLFDGSETVDFLDDGSLDDQLFLRTTLDGVINEGGFEGTVGGTASVALAGSSPTDLNLVLTNTAANGKFFGNAADVVSGTYSADAAFGLPGGATETAKMSGLFTADK